NGTLPNKKVRYICNGIICFSCFHHINLIIDKLQIHKYILMKYLQLLLLALIPIGLGSCEKKGGLQEGTWRGELNLSDNRTAPFLFEVKKTSLDTATFILINGDE